MAQSQSLFPDKDRQQIVQAIVEAEEKTIGEIQVHLENKCKGEPIERAVQVFTKLNMEKTANRTGVLFYLAVSDKKFAVVGDVGINQKVPEDFWDNIKDHMQSCFREGKFTQGLTDGINMAGVELQKHFPGGDNNINELPNEISFGDDITS